MARFPFYLFIITALISLVLPLNTARAATIDELKWSEVDIPTEGSAGDWQLAPGGGITCLTAAADGTLYAAATATGSPSNLFQSRDGGYSWLPLGEVTAAIVDIAIASDNIDIVYYATAQGVYKSTNGGKKFSVLPSLPGVNGGDVTITSLDIAWLEGKSIVAAGTRDSDTAQFGGIFVLNEADTVVAWADTGLAGYDIGALAFAPDYPGRRQLVAIASNEVDTIVTSRIAAGGWGSLVSAAVIKGKAAVNAGIAFPADYDPTRPSEIFAAIATGNDGGDIYRVKCMLAPDVSRAFDLDAGAAYGLSSLDFGSIAVSGNATTARLLAGTMGSAGVAVSSDGGSSWARSQKPPSGAGNTRVLAAPGTQNATAYAATSGTEGAVSITRDGGSTWNQVGLINTTLQSGAVLDFAVGSPDRDIMFLLTWGGRHSLWRRLDGAGQWERVCAGAAADELKYVSLASASDNRGAALFLAGSHLGNPVIFASYDEGQTFTRRALPFGIDAWLVIDRDSFFAASYNGSRALVNFTTDGGISFAEAVAGSQPLVSLAVSPDFARDGITLTGSTYGRVFISTDRGASFRELGSAFSPAAGISVAFDPDFAENRLVYAASGAASTAADKHRLFRLRLGTDKDWQVIDGTLPEGSLLNRLCLDDAGVLYAASSQAVNAAGTGGGLERSLDPDFALTPAFETVNRGLEAGTKLTGLWRNGHQIWALDTASNRLMTFLDTLTQAPLPQSPADRAPGVAIAGTVLDWQPLAGATEYSWQLDSDNDFSTVPDGFEGASRESSAGLPPLTLATTYYWRVRATEPFLSPWSAKRSFTTSLGAAVLAPELKYPGSGATAAIRPVFQWSAIAGADGYELMIAKDTEFAQPLVARIGDKALPATAWQSDISLDYGTVYYWKVRARSATSFSAWSPVGVFTTERSPGPSSIVPPASTTLPTVLPVSPGDGPDAKVLWLMVIAAVNSVALVAAVIAIIVLRRR